MSEQWFAVLTTCIGVIVGLCATFTLETWRNRRERTERIWNDRLAAATDVLTAHSRFDAARSIGLRMHAYYAPNGIDGNDPVSVLYPTGAKAERLADAAANEAAALGEMRAACSRLSLLWPSIRPLASELLKRCETILPDESQRAERVILDDFVRQASLANED